MKISVEDALESDGGADAVYLGVPDARRIEYQCKNAK